MRRIIVAVMSAGIAVSMLALAAGPAMAASTSPTGTDISYPQCGTTFPAGPAFGIAGVNDGLANNLNPCLGPSAAYPSYRQSELYWLNTAPAGGSSQPKASLYVNTADPGNAVNGTPIADWPVSGSTPYGDCITTTITGKSGTFTVGQNSTACAWQYGFNRAADDVTRLGNAASGINSQSPPVTIPGGAGSYQWWLDVETVNSWQAGTAGQAMNVADLQGMTAELQQAGASSAGIYSTSAQWGTITGATSLGTLAGIPDWIPGARSLSGAQANCSLASFTGGRVAVTQWTGRPDHDYAC
jgi:hypothetical protein